MNIFVANLNYRLTSDELREVFEDYGSVDSAKIITDRDTGRSKGFGFVEMSDDSEGKSAISALNGAEYDGRAIVVKEAEDRPKRSNDRGGNRRFNNDRY
jgi:RNA recognition motif-containing protein